MARFYDRIFPLEKEILDFLRSRFDGRVSPADIACGTGTYALALAEPGRCVVGIDLDEKMIDSARSKAAKLGLGDKARFAVADMRDLGRAALAGHDGLYCIGNSLVHLTDGEEVRAALEGFAGAMTPGGRLLVQIINFDRVLSKNVGELPTLSGDGVEFVRRYLRSGKSSHVVFETELLVEGNDRLVQRVPLFALKAKDLSTYAEEAGFFVRKIYGSYRGDPWDAETSFLTILEAEKA